MSEKIQLPDNCNPNWITQKTGSDGDTDTYYGQRSNPEQHGHTVQNPEGDIKYARTQGGHVNYDDRRSSHSSSSDSSSDNSDSGSGCFITTATLRALGNKDDNCRELTLFRNFRDKFLLSSAEGRKLVQLYYDVAPSLVQKIDASAQSELVYQTLWKKYISKGYEHLIKNEFLAARDLYISMMNELAKNYHTREEN